MVRKISVAESGKLYLMDKLIRTLCHGCWHLIYLLLLGVSFILLASYATVVSSDDSTPSVVRALHRYFGPEAVRGNDSLDWHSLDRFYELVGGQPVWITPGGPTDQARAVMAVLAEAADQGLDPERYRSHALIYQQNTWQPDELARFDLLLSDAVLRYARDLAGGRVDPAETDPNWHLPGNSFDAVGFLGSAVTNGEADRALRQLVPRHPAYHALRSALVRYQGVAAAGGWSRLTGIDRLELGAWGPEVEQLRTRLAAEGIVAEPGQVPLFFDQTLVDAVQQYQARNGLQVDGIVGRYTLEALNIPVAARVAQIAANMERWRWFGQELGSRYLLVNTAGSEVSLVEDGRVVFHTLAITGRRDRPSPSFASRIQGITVNPPWNVPLRIAVHDLLPMQQQDADYFTGKQIHVLRPDGDELVEVNPAEIDWSRYGVNNFPFHLRQEPGEQNSLGRVKFTMHNRFQVYLHDTPAKGLFRKDQRAFSSGCIRLERASDLAVLLMGGDPQQQSQKLAELIEGEETVQLPLSNRIPVYLIYLTAWVDQSGVLQFRRDVYGRDQLLMANLSL